MSLAKSTSLLLVSLLCVNCVPAEQTVCPYKECFCSVSNGVSCLGTNLKSLPPLRTGSDVEKVKLLFITSTEITKIPDNSLPPNLTTVYLSDSPISDISSNAFAASADTLIRTSFGKVNFSKVPDALLIPTNLKSLSIRNTFISDWNEPVLTHIGPTLKSLALENVGLTSWPQWLNLFPSLITIYFSKNSIPATTIPDDAFNLVKDNPLIALTISYAHMSHIPKAFLQIPNINYISLEGNNINILSNIPRTTQLMLAKNQISNATHLTEALLPIADTLEVIDLRSNHLSVIPDLSKMSKLTSVYLGENQISEHNMGSFPPSITKLTLNANKLSAVPLTIVSLSNLTELDLSLNMISEISPNSFPTQLMTLDLSNNEILKIMPDGLPEQLMTLDLTSNFITEITPGSIPEHLTELVLVKNKITQINENYFPDNSSLKILKLAENPISVIKHTAFQPLQELQTIDLANTALSKIPLALTFLPNLRQLYMVDIPYLSCTCPVDSELYQWFASKNIETVRFGKSSRCNMMKGYGLSVRLDDYLNNQACNRVITTPLPTTTTTADNGNNGASSLIHGSNLYFCLCIIMVLNALMISNVH